MMINLLIQTAYKTSNPGSKQSQVKCLLNPKNPYLIEAPR